MSSLKTEQLYSADRPLDSLPADEGARALIRAQLQAARSVEAAAGVIAAAAADIATTLRNGGTLYYAAAGSSGLMAAADGMELGGTFGLPAASIRILMAGGIPSGAAMPGNVEDQTETLTEDLVAIDAGDCLVAVSASGGTPYAVAAATLARAAGATVIAIANNRPAALFESADHAIYLDTPPEMVSGSTRLGAGTAQKIALNTLSTLMGVELGHVYRGRMVNLHADNDKLRRRARRIVEDVARVDEDLASGALEACDGQVKAACLVASGASSPRIAYDALEASQGKIGPALLQLGLVKT